MIDNDPRWDPKQNPRLRKVANFLIAFGLIIPWTFVVPGILYLIDKYYK